jgi:hypothetical protein
MTPLLHAAFRGSEQVELLPGAKSANERVRVLLSEKIGGFIQLQGGIIDIAASKLTTSSF